MAETDSARLRSPYVGPRPFHRGETIYGRERDIQRLLDLLLADRFVLLQAPSGAGKTSLVQAGLIPLLQEDFDVLPVARVAPLAQDDLGLNSRNPYLLSTLLSFEGSSPSNIRLQELAQMELSDYLNEWRERQHGMEDRVLVFDQFEELLVDPTDRSEKTAFMSGIGRAVRSAGCCSLFVAREEYVGPLYPYLQALRLPLSTFRLELMGEAAAREAIQLPAHRMGVAFSEPAVAQLVDDLRRVWVKGPDDTSAVLSPYIEPVQLQVVCYRLWQRLPPNTEVIEESHVAALSDTTNALADYYSDQVAAAAIATGVSERAIRDWFESQLITDQGFRSQTLRGPTDDKYGARVVSYLEDAYLVRAEHRRGALWFELGHDRMVQPVRRSNELWRRAHLQSWELAARDWHATRDKAFLLRGAALRDARQQVDSSDVEPIYKEFLEESARLERQERDLLEVPRRAIGLLGVVAVVELIVIVLLLLFLLRRG